VVAQVEFIQRNGAGRGVSEREVDAMIAGSEGGTNYCRSRGRLQAAGGEEAKQLACVATSGEWSTGGAGTVNEGFAWGRREGNGPGLESERFACEREELRCGAARRWMQVVEEVVRCDSSTFEASSGKHTRSSLQVVVLSA
jgi:hypothetical protein